jgi:ArsR family transcriptional regulator, virulence genes transcriptional regulator
MLTPPISASNFSMLLGKDLKQEDQLSLDLLCLKKAALILRSINHKLRQQILSVLDEAGKMTVTEVYVKLRIEQSVASQHLAILRRANAVKTVREGKYIYYMLNFDFLKQVNEGLLEGLSKN